MNCKKVKKYLPLFLEEKLSENIRMQIQDHLNACSNCSRLFDEFKQVWASLENRRQIHPSPDFWLKLQRKVLDNEEETRRGIDCFPIFIRSVRMVTAVVLLGFAIFLGTHLGQFPKLRRVQAEKSLMAMQKNSMFMSLGLFSDMPVNSIESISLRIKMED